MKSAQSLQYYFVGSLVLIICLNASHSFAQGKRAKEAKAPAAHVLSLDDYLMQVRKSSQAFASARLESEGAAERAGEYKILTRPSLIGNANYARSRAQTVAQGDDNSLTSYSLGFLEITNFGLQASLTYNMATNATNASTLAIPSTYGSPSATTAGPVLSLTQSLWRNWFGEEIRATQIQLEASALATRYSQSFAQKQILADAETAYWRLALAREQVAAAKEVLGLTERSHKWSANRQRLALTDRSDLLQANAALLARQLDLQSAIDAEKSASRYFNTVREADADAVNENLASFDTLMLEHLQLPDRVQVRDDVKALEQQSRLTKANALLGASRYTPTVNLTGTIGLNGRDPVNNEAVSQSFGSAHPNYGIGLAVNMPLDFGTLSDDRVGYRKEAQAADILYQRRVFEQERLWHDLTTLFLDASGRYRIAIEQEKAQREKVTYERQRHDHGRSTLYQVLLFEGDYAASQLTRIRAQADVLNAFAQLKTFGGEK